MYKLWLQGTAMCPLDRGTLLCNVPPCRFVKRGPCAVTIQVRAAFANPSLDLPPSDLDSLLSFKVLTVAPILASPPPIFTCGSQVRNDIPEQSHIFQVTRQWPTSTSSSTPILMPYYLCAINHSGAKSIVQSITYNFGTQQNFLINELYLKQYLAV